MECSPKPWYLTASDSRVLHGFNCSSACTQSQCLHFLIPAPTLDSPLLLISNTTQSLGVQHPSLVPLEVDFLMDEVPSKIFKTRDQKGRVRLCGENVAMQMTRFCYTPVAKTSPRQFNIPVSPPIDHCRGPMYLIEIDRNPRISHFNIWTFCSPWSMIQTTNFDTSHASDRSQCCCNLYVVSGKITERLNMACGKESALWLRLWMRLRRFHRRLRSLPVVRRSNAFLFVDHQSNKSEATYLQEARKLLELEPSDFCGRASIFSIILSQEACCYWVVQSHNTVLVLSLASNLWFVQVHYIFFIKSSEGFPQPPQTYDNNE